MRRLFALVGLALAAVSCQAKPVLVRPALEKEGVAYIYIASFPQEAQRLSFRIVDLSATRVTGERIPLSLSLQEVNSGEVSRERLLAFGELPPGSYTGLSLRFGKAILAGEQGEATLRVPEDPTAVFVPFVVERKKAVVLTLQLRYRESIREEFRFTAALSASVPGKLPTGLIGLATCREANTVTVFDKNSGRVVAVIPTGALPGGMALDPKRQRVYVALSGEDAVEVIDLLEEAVLDRVALAAGDNPVELALSPDGGTLLSANSGSNTVSVIDPSSRFERSRIPVGAGPQSIVIDRLGKKAYVLNALSNTVSVLDIANGIVTGTVQTESAPLRGQLARDGSLLYVLQAGSSFLAVVDTRSLSVTKRIYVGAGGTALKVDPQSGWIYLAVRNSVEVGVYDPFSLLPVDLVPVGGEVAYMTIDGEGNNLFLVLPEENRVRAVRLIGKETALEIDVGNDPYRVTLMGER